MADIDEDSEFGAIYESIEESGSDGDEYVAVSQPYPYMCPESKTIPRPPTAVATWEGPQSVKTKKPKLHQPSGVGNTTHLLTGAAPPHVNPLPLPQRRGVGSTQKPLQPQRSIKYKKIGGEESVPVKPKRPPKPGYLFNYEGSHPPRILPRVDPGYQSPPTPQAPPPSHYPYHQLAEQQLMHAQHQYQQQTTQTDETANEYDSIKETTRMFAARKRHQQMTKARAQDTDENAGGDRGGEGGVQMTTLSRKGFELSTGSDKELVSSNEELVSSGERGRQGQSRVVVILLSIAMVLLVIAVASLALSLYSISISIPINKMDCLQATRCAANNTGMDVAMPTSDSSMKTTPLQPAGNNTVPQLFSPQGGGTQK